MGTATILAIIASACFGIYVACVVWASRKIEELNDAPPVDLPLPSFEVTPPITQRRAAITELSTPLNTRAYRVWLYEGGKYREHVGFGRRPFRLVIGAQTWDQRGTHGDGLPVYARSDVPARKQRGAHGGV